MHACPSYHSLVREGGADGLPGVHRPVNNGSCLDLGILIYENLAFIKKHGLKKFLDKEAAKWKCPQCGGVICCHNGLCFDCSLDKLRRKKTYRWDES
jgi:hypothetical protein